MQMHSSDAICEINGPVCACQAHRWERRCIQRNMSVDADKGAICPPVKRKNYPPFVARLVSYSVQQASSSILIKPYLSISFSCFLKHDRCLLKHLHNAHQASGCQYSTWNVRRPVAS